MRTRGQFSKPAPFNYQSHQSLQKFRKMPIQQRAQQVVQDIFKIKVKGQQSSKLIMARNSAPTKQQEIKQLKKHIKLMQGQLKKKILQNPMLSKIFKTRQPTNGEMQHLDLYLQYVKLRQEQQTNDKTTMEMLQEMKNKQMTYELQICQLKQQKQQQQKSFIIQIQRATQKFQKLQKQYNKKLTQKQKQFEQETIERQSKIQDNNLIMEQLKRKNNKLTKQNKQLQNKINQYKKSQQQKIKSVRQQIENNKHKSIQQANEYKKQINELKKQIQKYKISIKQLQVKNGNKISQLSNKISQLSNKINQLSNQIAQKTLQIQQLDRFIQLEKESFDTQIYQLKNNYQNKIISINEAHQIQLLKSKQSNQNQIRLINQQKQQQIKDLKKMFQIQVKNFKEQSKNDKSFINQLKSNIKQKQSNIQKLTSQLQSHKSQTESYKSSIQIQLSTLKITNKSLKQENQSLNRKVSSQQSKIQKLNKQIQFISHQKQQLHSKYQKGFINTQNDIKHYLEVIDQLQRKIYIMGNQNMGLKMALQQKNTQQNKIKEFNRISQQTYQQKYKTIGRIQQIKHKLENYINSSFAYQFNKAIISNNNTFSSSIGNYRSNNPLNNQQNSSNLQASLTQSIQGLTLILDRLCQNYTSFIQTFQTLRKLKSEDQRQIQSILNHFLDIESREPQLEQSLLNYINIRKQLNKQQNSFISCGEEFLLQKKRQTSQFVIEKLIQLKVIKQYSSADHTASSYKVPLKQPANYNPKMKSHQSSNNYFMSSINNNNLRNSRHSKKNIKSLLNQQQYHSNNENYHSNPQSSQPEFYLNNQDEQCTYRESEYDSLQSGMNRRTNNMINNFMINEENANNTLKQRKSLMRNRQDSKSRANLSAKFYNRLSTQPSKCEQDIDQQSTYEIMDQNTDYSNLTKRQFSKSKLNPMKKENMNLKSMVQTANKNQLNKKYREQIKQKLLSGKGKRQQFSSGLSKQDIQKKYFMR